MTNPFYARLPAGILLAGIALAVAGCQSGMTYGTGKSPGIQTVQDIVGLAALSNEKPEPIDYSPRPNIVAPPAVGQLPPPADPNAAVLASNWPVDPDVVAAQVRADAAAREEAGLPMPNINVPTPPSTPKPLGRSVTEGGWTAEQNEAAKKLFADARAVAAVDENGNPVRRYLTDPPAEYRIPDAASPVEIVEKPKKRAKWKWWWQR